MSGRVVFVAPKAQETRRVSVSEVEALDWVGCRGCVAASLEARSWAGGGVGV